MAAMKYSVVKKYVMKLNCMGPLHIGSAVGGREEVLVHPVSGFPFIQASGIAGTFRAYYAGIYGEKAADIVFGASKLAENSNAADFQSRVRFSDGIFDMDTVKMELRPHVKINHATGSVTDENGSGQKFNMEYIGAGAVFTASVYVYENEDETIGKAVESILAAMRENEILLGAKKSQGAGKVKITEAKYIRFDLKNAEDRNKWGDEENLPDSAYKKDFLSDVAKNEKSNIKYSIVVKGETEGTILIGGIAVSDFGKNAPDKQNIRNSQGDFIVPGSSMKGAFRAQIEKIARYVGKESLIDECFGSSADADGAGKKGNLIFSDTVIGDVKSNENVPIQYRIHIDKFTGGVFSQGLFSEKAVSGEVCFTIDILDNEYSDASLGLIVYALRDLSIGNMNIGGGYSIGRGFINVNNIQIAAGDKKAALQFNKGAVIVNGYDEIINAAVSAVRK